MFSKGWVRVTMSVSGLQLRNTHTVIKLSDGIARRGPMITDIISASPSTGTSCTIIHSEAEVRRPFIPHN